MDQFTISQTIGKGTFGKVQLARHHATGEPLAIKTLLKSKITNQEDQQRIQREIKILKVLDHPHIIKLYKIVEDANAIYLIMEYADNGDLLTYLKRRKTIPQAQASRMISQLTSALIYMHSRGVAHRDVKLGNVLLDEKLNIKLADFGLSNTYNSNSKLTTSCGSPCFAAPEVISGRPYLPKPADTWSVGVLLYALLSGTLPFYHENLYQLYNMVFNGSYTPINIISRHPCNLIQRILEVSVSKRMSLQEISQHPFIKQHIIQKPSSNQPNLSLVQAALSYLGYTHQQIKKNKIKSSYNDLHMQYHLLSRMKTHKLIAFHENLKNAQIKTIQIKRNPFSSLNNTANKQKRLKRSPASNHKTLIKHYMRTQNSIGFIKINEQSTQSFTIDKSFKSKISISHQSRQPINYNSFKSLRSAFFTKSHSINIPHYDGPYNLQHVIQCNIQFIKHTINNSFAINSISQHQYQIITQQKYILKIYLLNGINGLYLLQVQPTNNQLINNIISKL